MINEDYSRLKHAIETFKSTYSGLDSFDVAENNNNNLVLVFDESIKFDVMNLIFINTMTNSRLREEAKILSNYL